MTFNINENKNKSANTYLALTVSNNEQKEVNEQ